MDELEKSYSKKVDMLTSLYTVAKEKEVVISLVDGSEKILPVFQIIRIYNPNEMGIYEKSCFYVMKF